MKWMQQGWHCRIPPLPRKIVAEQGTAACRNLYSSISNVIRMFSISFVPTRMHPRQGHHERRLQVRRPEALLAVRPAPGARRARGAHGDAALPPQEQHPERHGRAPTGGPGRASVSLREGASPVRCARGYNPRLFFFCFLVSARGECCLPTAIGCMAAIVGLHTGAFESWQRQTCACPDRVITLLFRELPRGPCKVPCPPRVCACCTQATSFPSAGLQTWTPSPPPQDNVAGVAPVTLFGSLHQRGGGPARAPVRLPRDGGLLPP